jgi:hypothetical protein
MLKTLVVALGLANIIMALWGNGALLRWGLGPGAGQPAAVVVAPERILPATPPGAADAAR